MQNCEINTFIHKYIYGTSLADPKMTWQSHTWFLCFCFFWTELFAMFSEIALHFGQKLGILKGITILVPIILRWYLSWHGAYNGLKCFPARQYTMVWANVMLVDDSRKMSAPLIASLGCEPPLLLTPYVLIGGQLLVTKCICLLVWLDLT